LDASLYAVAHCANPVAGAFWFRVSMRELFGGNLSPFGGAREKRLPRFGINTWLVAGKIQAIPPPHD
jgi:hypothetical protein